MHSCQPVCIIRIESVFELVSMSVHIGVKKYVFGSIPLIGSKKCMLGGLLTVCSHDVFVKVIIRENFIKFSIAYKEQVKRLIKLVLNIVSLLIKVLNEQHHLLCLQRPILFMLLKIYTCLFKSWQLCRCLFSKRGITYFSKKM